MTLYRALTVGLLGAGVWLLARPIYAPRPPAHHERRAPIATAALDPLRVIDAARGTRDLASLLKLSAGERVTEIDDVAQEPDPFAVARAIDDAADAHDYIDVTVGGGAGESRRMLILLH